MVEEQNKRNTNKLLKEIDKTHIRLYINTPWLDLKSQPHNQTLNHFGPEISTFVFNMKMLRNSINTKLIS